jgi:adenylosuccinate lyase
VTHEKNVLRELGLDRNSATTQIDDCGSLCQYLDHVRTVNNILIDLCQDIWMYVSYGYLVQRVVKHEVGSSTMPHKINPINFENAEGNLQLSGALLGFMTDKLSKSRMQRDLSGSTVMRNVGVALAHHYLALLQLEEGLSKVSLDTDKCASELESHSELLSEALQTILRTQSNEDVYDQVKNATRGKESTSVKNLLERNGVNLRVTKYTGYSSRICDDVINETEQLLSTL